MKVEVEIMDLTNPPCLAVKKTDTVSSRTLRFLQKWSPLLTIGSTISRKLTDFLVQNLNFDIDLLNFAINSK